MFSKRNRIVSVLLTLLPALLGVLLKYAVPGVSGYVSAWYLPVGEAAMLLLCIRMTDRLETDSEKNKKINSLMLWIFPVLSNFLFWMSWLFAAKAPFSPEKAVVWLLGGMFLVLGNYLPKCRRNSIVGIKLPWTFASEENWNATHRMAGPVWMGAGAVMILGSVLSENAMMAVMFAAITLAVLVPTVYSYRYFRNQKEDGKTFDKPAGNPKLTRFSVAALAVTFLFVGVMLFTGSVKTDFGADALHIRVSYYGEASLPYGEIAGAQLRQENVPGTRQFGLGSFRLLAGAFRNQELGDYTRYTYYDPQSAVVLTMKDGSAVVLSGRNPAETENLYRELLTHIG